MQQAWEFKKPDESDDPCVQSIYKFLGFWKKSAVVKTNGYESQWAMRVSLVVSLERLIFVGASIVCWCLELDFSDFFRSVQALLLDVLPQESGPADVFCKSECFNSYSTSSITSIWFLSSPYFFQYQFELHLNMGSLWRSLCHSWIVDSQAGCKTGSQIPFLRPCRNACGRSLDLKLELEKDLSLVHLCDMFLLEVVWEISM